MADGIVVVGLVDGTIEGTVEGAVEGGTTEGTADGIEGDAVGHTPATSQEFSSQADMSQIRLPMSPNPLALHAA